MTSIVIAAYNEGSVIASCVSAILADAQVDEFEVIVVANGCTDDTAAQARLHGGAHVVEMGAAGKAGALNAGDAVAKTFPRIYLDADIKLSTAAARALRDAVAGPDQVADGITPCAAAVPRREFELSGRPVAVKSYYLINSRLPVFRHGLFGRGAIAISEEGRSRFDQFPDMVADDLFLDSLFSPAEKCELQGITTCIATPLRTKDLVRRLVRVRRGNTELRNASRMGTITPAVRDTDRFSWLRDVVLRRPWLTPPAIVYVVITAIADVMARRSPKERDWGRDESTRRGD